MGRVLGYEYLRTVLSLNAESITAPATVKPVTRITRYDNCLAIPASRVPDDTVLQHILFALKHEGINLNILVQALIFVDEQELCQLLKDTPNSVNGRKIAFLYEHFQRRLDIEPQVKAGFVDFFPSEEYVTGTGRRYPRWRVNFNGLGTLEYCPVVRRTAALNQLVDENLLLQTSEFIDSLSAPMLERTVNWAYLSETKSSYAIEHETPNEDKQRRFVRLLQQAEQPRPLTEDYLIELQNATIANPFDKAVSFRTEQNFLHSGLRGAAGVSYVPPEPDLCRELMTPLMEFANQRDTSVDVLVKAAILSFGFVFLHPFMDGNGRISRFLIHYAISQANVLPKGSLLPVSIAIKRHEKDYLRTLQRFSAPLREFWNVEWLDGESYSLQFTGSSAQYRFWDATEATVFILRMAKVALEDDLKAEILYLQRFDAVKQQVDAELDIRGSDLALLIMWCFENQGRLSNRRRKQFTGRVPVESFALIEALVQDQLHHH